MDFGGNTPWVYSCSFRVYSKVIVGHGYVALHLLDLTAWLHRVGLAPDTVFEFRERHFYFIASIAVFLDVPAKVGPLGVPFQQ